MADAPRSSTSRAPPASRARPSATPSTTPSAWLPRHPRARPRARSTGSASRPTSTAQQLQPPAGQRLRLRGELRRASDGMGHILDEFLVELTAAAPVARQPPRGLLGAGTRRRPRGLPAHARDRASSTASSSPTPAPATPGPAWLLEHGVPFVAFGRIWDYPELTQWVDVDGRAGVRQAVVPPGRGRLPPDRLPGLARPARPSATTGARAGSTGCEAAGLADTVIVEEAVQDLDEATSAADRILDRLGSGGAVVCASDLLALGVMRAARNRGLEPGAGPRRRRLRRHRRRRGPPAHERPPAAAASAPRRPGPCSRP